MKLMNGADLIAEADSISWDDKEQGWRCANNIYVDSGRNFTLVDSASRRITRLQYMDRFTDAELAGIYTAAKTSVAIEVWLDKFKVATEINLDDPAHPAGLAAMVAAGLLSAERPAEILA